MHAIFHLMKRLFLAILFLATTALNAQIHEIGVFVGGANYIGDVGKTSYINPNEMAFGLLYKWNKSTRHSYRISFLQGRLTANDFDSDVTGRSRRGYNFANTVREITAGLEFNFFDFDLHQMDRQFTPYVFTGLTYTNYDELYVINSRTKVDINSGTFAIPMIVGIKGNIATNWILGLEIGARYTFTDNLDGSNPKNSNLQSLQFGNLTSNDWYVFSGLTLTYTFGNKPCFCAE
ncbi:MAG: hypothetical protein RLZZ500_706 [Bacteroidota bacterium]